MEQYTREDIMLFKSVIEDYKNLDKIITFKIECGYSIKELYDYVDSELGCDITNAELEEDYKYIDLSFKNMVVSILEYNDKLYLGDSIEVWNGDLADYYGLFNSLEELELLVKEYEENGKN